MSLSEITCLQNTLNSALDAFKAELAAQNLSEPSLNTSKPHPTEAITFLPTPVMFEARRAALASLVNSIHLSRWLLNCDSESYQNIDSITIRCSFYEYRDVL